MKFDIRYEYKCRWLERMKKPSSRFSTGNIVEVMDYEMGEEEIVVAHGKMTNVEENTFHGVIIYRYCMCF